LLALLPLVARNLDGGKAATFTLLLAAMGSGAVVAAMFLPRVRQHLTREALVLGGTAMVAAGSVVVVLAPSLPFAAFGMFAVGMAWISTANALSVSAQLALPDWVRARGMSMYQMAIMGGSAAGAAVWGQVATVGSVRGAMLLAAVSGVLTMLGAQRLLADKEIEEDLTPSRALKAPTVAAAPESGGVVTMIEYHIDPAKAQEFTLLMQESRRSRLRQGARAWSLLRDISDPGRYVEQIVDESWTEHLRRFERLTAADLDLRDRKLAFHSRPEPPVVTRMALDGD
jgi:MFS family permease